MVRALTCAACVVLAGCGSSPTSPSPAPTPTAQTVTITITETVSGATLGTMTAEVTRLPAMVPVSFADHLTRQAVIRNSSQTVDLISEVAPFDLGFYRQLARDGFESTGVQPLRVLRRSPSIYVQASNGLSVDGLEAVARATVPAFSGDHLTVRTWETGTEARALRDGWIIVSPISEPAGCGRATIGAPAGYILLNATNANCSMPSTFAHELGHALGFYHVDRAGALMKIPRLITDNAPSPLERYHAAIAYARSPGNLDIDSDPLTGSPTHAHVMVE